MNYRFPEWKDASWNSLSRHIVRYGLIRDHLGQNSVGAEVGVYKGGFGEFLLTHCRKLYLVDTWYRSGGFWKTGIENDSRVQTVIDILTIYKEQIERGQVEVVIENSLKFLNSMPDDHFDFIYIDASHAYEATIEEIRAAIPKLKKGGRLLGDDYDPDPSSHQHGVYRAVNEIIKEAGARMVLDASRQWGLVFDPVN